MTAQSYFSLISCAACVASECLSVGSRSKHTTLAAKFARRICHQEVLSGLKIQSFRSFGGAYNGGAQAPSPAISFKRVPPPIRNGTIQTQLPETSGRISGRNPVNVTCSLAGKLSIGTPLVEPVIFKNASGRNPHEPGEKSRAGNNPSHRN